MKKLILQSSVKGLAFGIATIVGVFGTLYAMEGWKALTKGENNETPLTQTMWNNLVDNVELLKSEVEKKAEKGEKGDPGEQGIQGEKGDTGLQGPAGTNGKDGKDGLHAPIDTNVNLGNSDTKVPSQKAVKSYVDNKFQNSGSVFLTTIPENLLNNLTAMLAGNTVIDWNTYNSTKNYTLIEAENYCNSKGKRLPTINEFEKAIFTNNINYTKLPKKFENESHQLNLVNFWTSTATTSGDINSTYQTYYMYRYYKSDGIEEKYFNKGEKFKPTNSINNYGGNSNANAFYSINNLNSTIPRVNQWEMQSENIKYHFITESRLQVGIDNKPVTFAALCVQ